MKKQAQEHLFRVETRLKPEEIGTILKKSRRMSLIPGQLVPMTIWIFYISAGSAKKDSNCLFIVGMFEGWWEGNPGSIVMAGLAVFPFAAIMLENMGFRAQSARDRDRLARILVPEHVREDRWIQDMIDHQHGYFLYRRDRDRTYRHVVRHLLPKNRLRRQGDNIHMLLPIMPVPSPAAEAPAPSPHARSIRKAGGT